MLIIWIIFSYFIRRKLKNKPTYILYIGTKKKLAFVSIRDSVSNAPLFWGWVCLYDGVRMVSGLRREPVVFVKNPALIPIPHWKRWSRPCRGRLQPFRCEFRAQNTRTVLATRGSESATTGSGSSFSVECEDQCGYMSSVICLDMLTTLTTSSGPASSSTSSSSSTTSSRRPSKYSSSGWRTSRYSHLFSKKLGKSLKCIRIRV